MSVLTDLIYGGSNAVAGLTEGAVNDAIAKYGADHPLVLDYIRTIGTPLPAGAYPLTGPGRSRSTGRGS